MDNGSASDGQCWTVVFLMENGSASDGKCGCLVDNGSVSNGECLCLLGNYCDCRMLVFYIGRKLVYVVKFWCLFAVYISVVKLISWCFLVSVYW